MRKIFVVGPSIGYANWMQGTLVPTLEEANLVVFTGGEDVTPLYYQQKPHRLTGCNPARDKVEIPIFREAIKLGKHIVGICRGSQLACVMNEGELIQHQNNPGMHMMNTYDGSGLLVTSTHHQAAFPFNLPEEDYKILGWTKGISKIHQNGDGEEMNPPKECEIVYYPKTKCLGIQPHPEHMELNTPFVQWVQKLLDKFMNNEL